MDALMVFSAIRTLSRASNGSFPLSLYVIKPQGTYMRYITIPTLHRSTSFPYPYLRRTSGAT